MVAGCVCFRSVSWLSETSWAWRSVLNLELFSFAGLYVMYTHMIKQRRKVFGGAAKGKTLGAKPKSQ